MSETGDQEIQEISPVSIEAGEVKVPVASQEAASPVQEIPTVDNSKTEISDPEKIGSISENEQLKTEGKKPIVKKAEEVDTSLENDPDVVEHFSRDKVEALVRAKCEFHKAPRSAVEQGLKSEIFVVKNDAFNRFMEKEYTDSGEEVAVARTHAEDVGGVNIPQEGGGSRIIIKESGPFDRNHVVDHELTHATGENGKGDGGFNRMIDGFTGNQNQKINEAATEILTLAREHPDLSSKELGDKIIKGKIKSAYDVYVVKMLTMMAATDQSEKPFTVGELAKYYYHDFEGDGAAVDMLTSAIGERVRPGTFDKSMRWLSNDLED